MFFGFLGFVLGVIHRAVFELFVGSLGLLCVHPSSAFICLQLDLVAFESDAIVCDCCCEFVTSKTV